MLAVAVTAAEVEHAFYALFPCQDEDVARAKNMPLDRPDRIAPVELRTRLSCRMNDVVQCPVDGQRGSDILLQESERMGFVVCKSSLRLFEISLHGQDVNAHVACFVEIQQCFYYIRG